MVDIYEIESVPPTLKNPPQENGRSHFTAAKRSNQLMSLCRRSAQESPRSYEFQSGRRIVGNVVRNDLAKTMSDVRSSEWSIFRNATSDIKVDQSE